MENNPENDENQDLNSILEDSLNSSKFAQNAVFEGILFQKKQREMREIHTTTFNENIKNRVKLAKKALSKVANALEEAYTILECEGSGDLTFLVTEKLNKELCKIEFLNDKLKMIQQVGAFHGHFNVMIESTDAEGTDLERQLIKEKEIVGLISELLNQAENISENVQVRASLYKQASEGINMMRSRLALFYGQVINE